MDPSTFKLKKGSSTRLCEFSKIMENDSFKEILVRGGQPVRASEPNFLLSSCRDRVRSLVIQEVLKGEQLLPHVERSQLKWLRHLLRMPLGRLSGEVFGAYPTNMRPQGPPKPFWRASVSRLASECLRQYISLLITAAAAAPTTRAQISSRKWMDAWNISFIKIKDVYYLFFYPFFFPSSLVSMCSGYESGRIIIFFNPIICFQYILICGMPETNPSDFLRKVDYILKVDYASQ